MVLAGGLARRMGGGDKSLRFLAGRPILRHVMERLQPQVAALALNANGDPLRFADFGVPVIADPVADNPGPLAGILAGMLWAEQAVPGATHVLTVPGDTPFIPTDLAVRLDTVRGQSPADIAVAESEGIAHPVVALWPVDLAAPLQAALGEGMGRVWDFLDRYTVLRVPFAADGFDPFLNINTPEDLAEAERRAMSAG
jgi:molybdopterin-guanine dinucleotide biosynthesis protein A